MYDELSGDYDVFVDWPSRLAAEIDFLDTTLSSVCARRVLDAACGTGQHAIALSQRGYQVTGADFSTKMIERAVENAEASAAKVKFAVAGFGELRHQVGAGFDALICLGNSLPHVADLADLQRTLADFAECLRPGGVIIIQNRNFDAVLDEGQRWMGPQYHTDDRGEWLFVRFYDFEDDGTLTFNMLTLRREPGRAWTQRATSTKLMPIRHDCLEQEMLPELFGDVMSYGDLRGAEYQPLASPNHVIVARRA